LDSNDNYIFIVEQFNDKMYTKSILYRTCMGKLDSIYEHKWYMSEVAGTDVGMDSAIIDHLFGESSMLSKVKHSETKETCEQFKQMFCSPEST